MKQGDKFDTDKNRYELLSPTALDGLTKVLTHGAKKYKDRNWEKGIKWSRVFGAMMRHSWAMWKGEDIDPESGLPHIDHVQACAHFLSYYRVHRDWFDDRPAIKRRRK